MFIGYLVPGTNIFSLYPLVPDGKNVLLIHYAPGGNIFLLYHLVPGGNNVFLIYHAPGGNNPINMRPLWGRLTMT
jgi:hypothetical protein